VHQFHARTRVLSLLPKRAATYRKQVQEKPDGNERAMARAHLILRELLGPISLTPRKKGELWASYRLNPAALVNATGTHGRGDAAPSYYSFSKPWVVNFSVRLFSVTVRVI
jgi:hypothetical protein